MDRDENKTEYIESDYTESDYNESGYDDVPMEEEKKKVVKVYNRSKAMRIIAIEIFTFILLVGAVVAWFAMSKETETGGMSMETSDLPFELKISQSDKDSAENAYNDYINQLDFNTQNIITGEKSSIRWVMKDESPNNDEESLGIKPGSYGSLTFYIIPHESYDMTIRFRLDVTGYYAEFEEENPKQIKSGTFKTLAEMALSPDEVAAGGTSKYTKAADFIEGHILFFEDHKILSAAELDGRTDNLKYYDSRIDGEFTYDTAEHQDDIETVDGVECYKVQLYWIWPNTFGQILFDKGNRNLFDTAMFSSLQTNGPRNALISYISANCSKYFMSGILSRMTVSELAGMMTTESLSNTDALITLSNGYNSADQVIGENVRFICTEIQTTGYDYD